MIRVASSPNADSPLFRLLNGPMRPGVVTWIGLRPGRREPVLAVPRVELDPDQGLVGDHYRNRGDHARQVTLMQAEHLVAIAAYLGHERVEPGQVRRNIVVAGINLHALKDRRFLLGSALLMGTGECHPCSHMEQALGAGGYNAVRGHGGITARILQAGQVCLGDPVERAS